MFSSQREGTLATGVLPKRTHRQSGVLKVSMGIPSRHREQKTAFLIGLGLIPSGDKGRIAAGRIAVRAFIIPLLASPRVPNPWAPNSSKYVVSICVRPKRNSIYILGAVKRGNSASIKFKNM